MTDISTMVWEGASAEAGVIKIDGVKKISSDNIVSWASANWDQLNKAMNEMPPMMDGPNGGHHNSTNSTTGAY